MWEKISSTQQEYKKNIELKKTFPFLRWWNNKREKLLCAIQSDKEAFFFAA